MDGAPHMLDGLQQLLAGLYGVDLDADVRDFLVTDPDLVRGMEGPGGRGADEKLLVREEGEHLDLALFLDAGLLARLARRDPVRCLSPENLADFCLALEGVSHFIYLAWNATADRSVTLLEMELQAEVDKYIAARVLMARQRNAALADELYRRLFDEFRFRADLQPGELDRYQHAASFASVYCRSLECRYEPGHPAPAMTRELREFWRLPQPDKLSRIHRAAFA